jgi:hypothetical protein
MSLFPLSLDQERARRLRSYLQEYRTYLLTQRAPSTERNTIQRLLQALQGKLMHESERVPPGGSFSLLLSGQEAAALKTMAVDLRALRTQEPSSEHRNASIADLTALKGMVERLPSSERTYSTQSLL